MRIIYTRPDGDVSVIVPAINTKLTIEEIAIKRVPVGCAYEIVEDSVIPADREFRGAWKCSSGKIDVDFVKAQEITKNRLREERQPLLEKLDVEVMKNITDPVKLAEIEAQKQVFRDITKVVDALTTVEELKAVKCQ